jgi:hypothetical protein
MLRSKTPVPIKRSSQRRPAVVLAWGAMKTPLVRTLLLLSLGVALTASCSSCGGHPPPPAAAPPVTGPSSDLPASNRAETRSDPALARCHAAFKPASHDADVAASVDALAAGCADATKMKKLGNTLSGEAREKGAPVIFPLAVQADRCYRLYGFSQSSMQDFDISWVDSVGALIAQDTTHDASPVVAGDGKVCFKVSDVTSLRASAAAGVGKFALQVWGD